MQALRRDEKLRGVEHLWELDEHYGEESICFDEHHEEGAADFNYCSLLMTERDYSYTAPYRLEAIRNSLTKMPYRGLQETVAIESFYPARACLLWFDTVCHQEQVVQSKLLLVMLRLLTARR